MNVKEYKTAAGNTPQELDEKVNGLIKEGFEPHGGPYCTRRTDISQICQAMVKTRDTSGINR